LAITVSAGKLYYGLDHDVHVVSTDAAETLDEIVGTAINFDQNPPNGTPSGEPAGLAVSGNKVFWTTATRQGVEGDDREPRQHAEAAGRHPVGIREPNVRVAAAERPEQ